MHAVRIRAVLSFVVVNCHYIQAHVTVVVISPYTPGIASVLKQILFKIDPSYKSKSRKGELNKRSLFNEQICSSKDELEEVRWTKQGEECQTMTKDLSKSEQSSSTPCVRSWRLYTWLLGVSDTSVGCVCVCIDIDITLFLVTQAQGRYMYITWFLPADNLMIEVF